MTPSRHGPLTCSNCGSEVSATDTFCPQCGGLFGEDLMCAVHPEEEAEGVCVICRRPLCGECGTWVRDKFLCERHEDYEIIEGMARVYGISDEAQAGAVRTMLEQAGLHAVIYRRKTSPLSLGGPDYTLFRASGEFDGHLINEVKVMVPLAEVEPAEKTLRDLGVTT